MWLAQLASLVFLSAWIYIQYGGGWLLRVTPPAANAWGFLTYFFAMVADVLFFCGTLWLLSGAEGRKHVNHTWWFIASVWAVLPLSYYGVYGPEAKPPIAFPYDTLIALGIGIVGFVLGVLSGFDTDELKEIVAASKVAPIAVAPAAGSGSDS